jgi:hypothetical protein
VLLLRLLEFSFVVLFLALLLTQVVVPAVKGTHLFPLFDRKRRRAFDELSDVRDQRELEAVKKKVRAERQSQGDSDDV